MHALKKSMLLPILVATAAFSNAQEAPMSEPPGPRPEPLSQASEASEVSPAVIETQTGDAPAAPRHGAIDAIINEALASHPSIKSAMAQVRGKNLDIDVAKWARWPTLTVNAQRTDEPQSASGGSNFTISQPLWTGGAISSRVKAAENLSQASAHQVEITRADLALRLVDAWAVLLEAQATQEATESTLQGLKRYQGIMQRRVSAGLSSAVELRLLSVRVSRAQTDLDDARASIHIAAQRLSQIAGAPVDAQLSDLKSPIDKAALYGWAKKQSILQASERMAQHPAIAKAQMDASAAQHQLDAQKADRWPKLMLNYQRQLGDLPTQNTRNTWALALTYSSGSGMASLSQAQADQARLQAKLDEVAAIKQDKREQLLQDWTAFQREFDRQDSLQMTIDSAADVLASYERLYFGGLKSWLEVLNALQEVGQAKLRLAQTTNASTIAYYRLRLRMSDLPTNSD